MFEIVTVDRFKETCYFANTANMTCRFDEE